jgi:hypothetical protein
MPSFSGTSYAGAEYDAYFKWQHFSWNEFEDGSEAVKERGPLLGGGASATWDINSFILGLYGEGFGGRVKYDGKTTGVGPSLSIRTDTDYLGFEGGGKIGWRFQAGERSSIEPFIGPSVRFWNRIIQGKSKDGISVADTEEDWFIIYAPVGIEIRHSYNDELHVFAKGGVNIPLYNENRADLRETFGVTVTVKPGKEVSFFAEAGLRWKIFRATVFYDSMKFSESDPVTKSISAGTLRVIQPKSESDMAGFTIGVSF